MDHAATFSARLAPLQPLFARFADAGYQLHAVGGFVRDALLGVDKAPDYDLCTDAVPDEVVRILRAAGMWTYTVGARFGTVATRVNGVPVEITTYRVAEQYEAGNRKPEVTFGTDLVADLQRRDLSINAMAVSGTGWLVDPFGGARALVDRVLEVPGGGYDHTVSIFRDDPLRILRLARFLARLDFVPSDDATAAATVCSTWLQSISHERWKGELDRLFVSTHVAPAMQWLWRTRSLHALLPALDGLSAVDANALPQRFQAAAPHGLGWPMLALYLAAAQSGSTIAVDGPSLAATRDARHAAAAHLRAHFRLSNEEAGALQRTLTLDWDVTGMPWPPDSPQLRRGWDACGAQVIDGARLLHLVASQQDQPAFTALTEALTTIAANENPVPHLPTGLGDALLAAGVRRGPAIGKATREVREAILDGHLVNPPSIEDCLAWLARES